MAAKTDRSVTAAALQFESEPGSIERNLAHAEHYVRQAAAQGAELVVLPELAINGYDLDWLTEGAPGAAWFPDQVFDRLAQLSDELQIVLSVCELERSGGHWYDTAFTFDCGALVSRHQKAALTPREVVAGLSVGTAPALPTSVAGDRLRIASMICYEYAFPEISLHLARHQVEAVTLSLAVRREFAYLLTVKLRARALDNSCYMVCASATGRSFSGSSMIVGPRGDVLAQATTDDSQVLIAEIHPAVARTERGLSSPTVEEHLRVEALLRLAAVDTDAATMNAVSGASRPSSAHPETL